MQGSGSADEPPADGECPNSYSILTIYSYYLLDLNEYADVDAFAEQEIVRRWICSHALLFSELTYG